MELSFTGLIIALLIILPGAIWLQYRKRHFPMRRLDAAELLIESLKYGSIVHFMMLLVAGAGYTLSSGLREYLNLHQNILVLDFNKLTIFQAYGLAITVLAYTLACCVVAYLSSFIGCRIISTNDRARQTPVWLNFLDAKSENFLKIRMTDGTTYIGRMAIGPFSAEELDGDNREFVLTDVHVIYPGSNVPEPVASSANQELRDYVLISGRNVSTVSLLRKG